MRVFMRTVSEGFVTTGIRHVRTHTICVHPLRSLVPPPPPRIFSTLPRVQVVDQHNSGNGWLWTAGLLQRVPFRLTTVHPDLPSHAESMGDNLNRGGDGRRATHKNLKHVEDRQARVQVPQGVGVRQTTRARATRGEGADNTCLYH